MLLLYYTRVQITAILLWDSTIVPIICNIEQEADVHQHLETYRYSKKSYSCCHAGLFKVYIKMRVSFFEVPALFYLVNEEIQCGKIQTITCSILNFSYRFTLNWLVCNIKVQEIFFSNISVILNLSLNFFSKKTLSGASNCPYWWIDFSTVYSLYWSFEKPQAHIVMHHIYSIVSIGCICKWEQKIIPYAQDHIFLRFHFQKLKIHKDLRIIL